MPAAKATTDHDFIRSWAEERKGVPSTVKSTKKSGETGVLRIDFKGEDDSDDRNLQPIEWEEFFHKFEEAQLAFLCQEKTADGSPSRFFKLVKRDSARGEGSTARRAAPKRESSARGSKRASGSKPTTRDSGARKEPAKRGKSAGSKTENAPRPAASASR